MGNGKSAGFSLLLSSTLQMPNAQCPTNVQYPMPNLNFSLLEKIAASLPGVIFQVLQRQNNLFVVFVSSRCQELCELEPEAIQNNFQVLLNLLQPQDIQIFSDLFITSNTTNTANITIAPWCWEGKIITPSSKIKWVQISVHPEKQANGDILWEGLVMDITARKLTEENLRATEGRYKALAEKFSKAFRCSPDPITISTLAEGRYIEVNDSFVRLTGITRDEAVGKTSCELGIWVNPSDRTQLLHELETKGAVNNLEFEFRCQSGQIIITQLSAEIIDWEGVKCILAINKDITKRKQAELELYQLNINLERQVEERTAQLQQKMQEIQELSRIKDVMLHTVSHDLRTSVIGNLMVLNNLIEGKKTAQAGDSPTSLAIPDSIVQRMIQGNERQLGMIDSLLEINAGDTKALIMHQEEVKFDTLIKAIIQDIASLLDKYQAKLKNFIGDNLPIVKADQELLRKTFVALLTYSCQNNPPGLNITLKAKIADGKIHCTIQDDGIGMNKQECDRFFDLHIRNPQSRSSTSTCLKLYMCRQIIKAHGGEISAIHNRKRGLTFLFTLPIVTG
ncbi:PAS domain-containing sensor histidine kinase [Calothrix sp. UHCC 0171]|uniref:PAS domain-containing sensor histidine kinase n=1 Tax=Calothrix sp. UHCC 0171 TaxID=3110245 RepID=UPI002B221647|nr:PAS domain-containing sensor histidine kinase [Calothrix sp. UHCC 0171]MEA5569892.1 PAS domain-containing sensor histidine kinase [Calothrix sp. UHCC 0171]